MNFCSCRLLLNVSHLTGASTFNLYWSHLRQQSTGVEPFGVARASDDGLGAPGLSLSWFGAVRPLPDVPAAPPFRRSCYGRFTVR